MILGLDHQLYGLLPYFLGDLIDALREEAGHIGAFRGSLPSRLDDLFQEEQEFLMMVLFIPAGICPGMADGPQRVRLDQQAVVRLRGRAQDLLCGRANSTLQFLEAVPR